ncbi:uncharacterized protein LOC131843852 isoform X2 [Achroia grisella]|uniref:uncharacterized protein LOC131843852 isoform X2 n=1 Tax=Achroia grisella TaxID=688607 RepID=UPI0027D2B26C|nr:uncharacterized protein LOC131843852 isoform X2 [Achroia grisella]
MSDMIINDSVPVDKKWGELIRYNIFIMKLVEFVLSMVLMIIPFALNEADIIHCLAVSPTLVMSIMFIILYLVDQVHDLAEQLYLIIQITLNVVALCGALMLKQYPTGALYGLFYCHLLIALCIDAYYVIKERGFALLHPE